MQFLKYKFPTQIHRVNWLKLPSGLGKLSNRLIAPATDGYFLAATKTGGFLTPLFFLAGLFWGWLHFDFQHIYIESKWFLLLAIVAGSFSGHLGLAFTLGFVIGDVLLARSYFTYDNEIIKRSAHLVSYFALFSISALQAVTVKYLVAEIKFPAFLDRYKKAGLTILLYATLTYFYIHFWIQLTPLWFNGKLPSESINLLDNKLKWLVWPGTVMAIVRLIMQFTMALKPANQSFYETIEDHFSLVSAQPSLGEYINKKIKIIIGSAIAALLFFVLYSDWKTATIVGLLSFFFQALSIGLITRPHWLNKWAKKINNIPSLFRIVAGFILIFFLSKIMIKVTGNGGGFLSALTIITALTLLILFFLNPGKTSNASSYDTGK